ncbi:hypothetical protein HMPREF1624_07218 [Sporothrix schenckii ATCC 58251]|uniref:Ras-GEF domain-containing protein n=1 Tax=Sporothrix schenckii (strain ATCC 58251 / de Perez 2211183) TaxID=1391915 RepID=U7PKY0_SPOS1|nr:hypothetical protein HMPREF1624_07218 [Sporothrix schenckii ATCC 58251]
MSSNNPRARTHTLPDDRALFMLGRVPRRKSSSSLPAAVAQSRRRTPSSASPGDAPPSTAAPPASSSPSASVTASSTSSLPPQHPHPSLPSLQTAVNPDTDPTISPIQVPAVTPIGPWSGTFLDADPDGDADSEEDFFDAPEPTSDSDIDTISASLPELRQPRQLTARSQPLSQSSKPPRASPQSPLSKATQHQLPPQREHPTSLSPPPPSSTNIRDSFISILDDPFFQRYHTAGTDWFGDDDSTLPGPSTPSLPPDPPVISYTSSRVDAGTASPDPTNPNTQHNPGNDRSAGPPSRREPVTVNDQGLRPPPPRKMATVNIAVIGADGVGKSSFIQRAMRLAKPPTGGITAMRIDVDNNPFIVVLIELDLEHFDVDPKQKIHWPKRISGHIVPRIDGALMLYDVMNRDSIRELPPTLSALHNSNLPTILVATKCDNPESARQINADGLANLFPSLVADFKTSANVSGNTRDCLQAIVLAAVYNRQGDKSNSHHNHNRHQHHNTYSSSSTTTTNTSAPGTTTANTNSTGTTASTTTTRRRAASSAAHLDAPPDRINGRPQSSEQGSGKHSRASSDLSLLRGVTTSTSGDRDGYYRSQNSRSPRVDSPNAQQQINTSSFGAEMTDERSTQSVQGMLRSTGVRLDAGQDSFLDIEESDAESLRRFSEDVPILQRNDDNMFDIPAKAAGIPFNDLVERLLAAPMNRADANFSDVFLCLYRKFAAPHELLSAIISALTKTWEDKASHFLERTATQFRYIEVLNRWVSLYPGDFARPASRKQLEVLIYRLAEEPIFTLSAQQIKKHLDNDVAEDDDTWWAKCDDAPQDEPTAAGATPSKEQPPADSLRSLTLQNSQSSDQPSSEAGSGGAGASASGSSGTLAATLGSGRGLAHFQYHSYEDYEREAATMVPMATLPLNKFRYHIFMDMDANEVADEITRIDWIMFSSIRIRDLVRHVSLSAQEKERCRSLRNMDRMISHFNHIAKWVANMILIRDKAKHRAPCLQKFMAIALRLRQLRNYNGLAAMLAGINSTAIHRLAQTRALVDPDIQKSFARLVLLMSTQKSHFAYRLAWENSPLPRIPFMPLHRRDLVSAEEGSRTFVGPQGDRVNWKKFEVLGEVLLPLMKSQGTPYPNLKKHQPSREMILDCRMPMDEEDIYQRSVQVEPTGGAADLKKKFPWLPK